MVERVDSVTQYIVSLCDTPSHISSVESTNSIPICALSTNTNMLVDFLYLYPVILRNAPLCEALEVPLG